MLLTSMIMNKIRTMWMTPLFIFWVLLIYIFQKNIVINKLKKFFIIYFLILLYPAAILVFHF